MKTFAIVLAAILGSIQLASVAAADIDVDILNFALNLECLEAEFYSFAAFGKPLSAADRGGGPRSTGGRKARLTPYAQALAEDIAMDEIAHVQLLRAALGKAAVPCPRMNLMASFNAAANAALNTTLSPRFNPYGSDTLFYHGAFIFEDVGVTAYHGAAPLITSKAYLSVAAGILGTEAYHAGAIRDRLITIEKTVVFPYGHSVEFIIDHISKLRAAAGGGKDGGLANLVPSGSNALVYSRNTSEVLAIVYLGSASKPGGFFPKGLNGAIK